MTVTSYQLKNGTKRWCFRFAYTDNSGTRRYHKSSKFRTKVEAEHAEVEMRHKLNAGEQIRHGDGNLGDFLRLWLQRIEASGSVKPTTVASYKGDLLHYVIPRLGALPLRKLTPTVIAKMYGDLLAHGRIKKNTGKSSGLASKSVRNIGGTLHKALHDGVRWNYFPNNPCDKVDLPRWDRPEPKGWDEVETGRFLWHVMNDDPVLYALYRLAFNASLRKGELLGLRWSDIDLVDNTVTVVQTRTVVNGRIIVGTPKSRRSRRSEKIDQETTNALARLKDAQEASEQASGGQWWSDYVATDLLGRPLHPLTFTRTFQRYGEALGLPRITMHEVRHTSVFIGEMSGVGITTMSGRLGHADPGFTLRTYSPYLKSADTNGADAIGLSFDRAMRQAKLDTDELKTGTLGHKTDTELQKSAETTRHENIENDIDIELNATAERETLEATPGIEPGYGALQAHA